AIDHEDTQTKGIHSHWDFVDAENLAADNEQSLSVPETVSVKDLYSIGTLLKSMANRTIRLESDMKSMKEWTEKEDSRMESFQSDLNDLKNNFSVTQFSSLTFSKSLRVRILNLLAVDRVEVDDRKVLCFVPSCSRRSDNRGKKDGERKNCR
ncbi:hypothetical protein U1Q18_051144, partial [Sarracenia purpurea var. burkii]